MLIHDSTLHVSDLTHRHNIQLFTVTFGFCLNSRHFLTYSKRGGIQHRFTRTLNRQMKHHFYQLIRIITKVNVKNVYNKISLISQLNVKDTEVNCLLFLLPLDTFMTNSSHNKFCCLLLFRQLSVTFVVI